MTTVVILPENFMLRFPELSGCDRLHIEQALQQASMECPLSTYGCWRLDAIANLAAHKLALQYFQAGVIAGMAVEAAKGGTPALPKLVNGSSLSSTSYGQEFIRIRAGLPITGIVT